MAEAGTAKRQRVAFFGGSFDPPHLGHLAVARAGRDALRLDTVLFAPVGAQPLKPQGSTAPFEDRVAMTTLAIAGERGFALSQIDAPNAEGKPNYTLHTLQRLQTEMPDAVLFCLMGADSFAGLRKWYRAPEIPYVAALVVASRPGENLGNLAGSLPASLALEPAGHPLWQPADPAIELRCYSLRDDSGRTAAFYLLPGLDVEISASDIRKHIRTGEREALGLLVPPAVAEYIRAHQLYH